MSVGVAWFPVYGHIVAGIFFLNFIFTNEILVLTLKFLLSSLSCIYSLLVKMKVQLLGCFNSLIKVSSSPQLSPQHLFDHPRSQELHSWKDL